MWVDLVVLNIFDLKYYSLTKPASPPCLECRNTHPDANQPTLTQGSLRGRRFALVGFPDGLANQDSVPPLNGGAGGRNPQIRVLPPPTTTATHQYISPTAPPITNNQRSPTARLLPTIKSHGRSKLFVWRNDSCQY